MYKDQDDKWREIKRKKLREGDRCETCKTVVERGREGG